MISNPFTYFFLSTLMASYAFSLIIRVALQKERKKYWGVVSPSVLIYLILALLLVIVGLLFFQSHNDNEMRILLIYGISLLILIPLCFMLKKATFPVVFIILLGMFFYFEKTLEDFTPFGEGRTVTIRVLKSNEVSQDVEVNETRKSSRFYSFENTSLTPLFAILEFPKFLFILENNRFYHFIGFKEEHEILEPEILIPPFLFEAVGPPVLKIESTAMNTLSIEFKSNGEVSILQ